MDDPLSEAVAIRDRLYYGDCLTSAAIDELTNRLGAVIFQAQQQWKAVVSERDRLWTQINQWAADECDDPEDHAQSHSPTGVAQGSCRRCGMSWPCPSNMVAERYPTLTELVESGGV